MGFDVFKQKNTFDKCVNKHQSKQIKVIPYIVTTAVIFINRVHFCVRCIDVMKQLIKGCNLKGNTNSSP